MRGVRMIDKILEEIGQEMEILLDKKTDDERLDKFYNGKFAGLSTAKAIIRKIKEAQK